MIIQYTTPSIRCHIKGIDLRGYDIWLSLQQGKRREVDVQPSSVEYSDGDTVAIFKLTQEQSAVFKPGAVELQVNWITPDGHRDATLSVNETIILNRLEKVVEYGD